LNTWIRTDKKLSTFSLVKEKGFASRVLLFTEFADREVGWEVSIPRHQYWIRRKV